jgi:hypothetical protein
MILLKLHDVIFSLRINVGHSRLYLTFAYRTEFSLFILEMLVTIRIGSNGYGYKLSKGLLCKQSLLAYKERFVKAKPRLTWALGEVFPPEPLQEAQEVQDKSDIFDLDFDHLEAPISVQWFQCIIDMFDFDSYFAKTTQLLQVAVITINNHPFVTKKKGRIPIDKEREVDPFSYALLLHLRYLLH